MPWRKIHGSDAQRHDDADRRREAEDVSAGTQAYLDRMSSELFRLRRLRLHRQGRDAGQVSGLRCGGTVSSRSIRRFSKRPRRPKGELETDMAYDDVPMQWTKDAKEAIRAVPAGFQRRRAKARIEKSARKLGMTTITLEYAAPMIKEAAAEDYNRSLPIRVPARPQ